MKKRKLAAPIVISVLVGLWLLGYAVLIFLVPAIPLWIRYIILDWTVFPATRLQRNRCVCREV